MLKTYLQFEIDYAKIVHTAADINLELNIDVVEGDLRGNFPKHGLSNNIITQYTPSVNDAFYFLPGVLVPRVKLKDLYAKEKIKNVRDITKATHVFCGAKTFDTITLDIVLVKDWNSIRPLRSNLIDYQVSMFDITNSSQAFVYVKGDYLEVYKSIQGLDLYDDQALMPHINGPDSVTIDEAMFQTLDTMLNSSDKDNRVVAMEIMANCNYQESLVHLCVLFHDHGHKISDMPSKNHVNFKSLVNYMGLTSRSLDITRDKCVDILIAKNRFDVAAAEYLLNKFADSIPSESYSKYFQVKRVCLSPELDAMLNHELTLDIKEDYKPVINETPIEDEPVNNFLNF